MGKDSGEPLPQFEAMTLSNIGDGRLEQEFQDHLSDAQAIWDEAPIYEQKSDGRVTAKITITVELGFDPDSKMKSFGFTSKMAPPNRKKVVGAVYQQNGVVLVEPDRQASLYPVAPTPINARHQED